MRLDLLIATFRRPLMLAQTLKSVLEADKPAGLALRVIVVNNDSEGALALDQLVSGSSIPILVLSEPRRGKSNALNTGIAASDADFIGFIDDDEVLAPSWLTVAYERLASGRLDFIGGPMLPIWPAPPPAWIPEGYGAVLGIVDSGSAPVPYSKDFPGLLVGGNAVIRRALFEKIGGYAAELGPQRRHRLMSCEDEDMYWRLVDCGARGEYVPELVVHHYVHPERIARRYHRAWCFWNGASKGLLTYRRPPRVTTIAGVPRYVYGRALHGTVTWLRSIVTRSDPATRFGAELPLWQLAGFLYGRYGARCLRAQSTSSGERPKLRNTAPAAPSL